MRGKALWTSMLLLAFLAVAAAPAAAQTPAPATPPAVARAGAARATGGAAYGVVFQPTVPGLVAQIVNGVAYAPDQAPDQVKQAIWAANQIVGMPYRLGGGHKLGFTDHAYDCSGTVSFAMHGAACWPRRATLVVHALRRARARAQWITVYTNPGHAFAVIAGLRLDTSAAGDPGRRLGPALAPEPALDARLPRAPPRRAVASAERGRRAHGAGVGSRPRAGELDSRGGVALQTPPWPTRRTLRIQPRTRRRPRRAAAPAVPSSRRSA